MLALSFNVGFNRAAPRFASGRAAQSAVAMSADEFTLAILGDLHVSTDAPHAHSEDSTGGPDLLRQIPALSFVCLTLGLQNSYF